MRLKAALAVPALLALAGRASAGFGMPDAAADRGRIIVDLYEKIFLAGLAVFLLVFVLLVVILLRYRESTGKGRATHERERHNTAAEVVWLVGPLILVLWIGVISYQGLVKLDAPQEEPEGEIKVTAGQWFWQFDYTSAGGPGVSTIVTTTEMGPGNYSYSDVLRIPADTTLKFNLTATDVIHALQIHDPNGAPFTFSDANPLGEHRFTGMTTKFPAGLYQVRCNKFCQNPGHANMLAQIHAMPRAEFDSWLKHRSLGVGANLTYDLKVTVNDDGFTPSTPVTLVQGQRLIVQATNAAGRDVTFLAGSQQATVAAGATDFFAFDFGSGNHTIVSTNGGNVTVSVVNAEPIEVTLDDFTISPTSLRLEAGTQYLIKVDNQGNQAHNIYIGNLASRTILFQSADLPGGASGGFLFTPATTGDFDTWCNVPGHLELGMRGTAHLHT